MQAKLAKLAKHTDTITVVRKDGTILVIPPRKVKR